MTIFFDQEEGDWFVSYDDGTVVRWTAGDAMGNYMSDYPILPVGSTYKIDPDTWGGKCEHEWAVYDSGLRKFEFCKKCNEERQI